MIMSFDPGRTTGVALIKKSFENAIEVYQAPPDHALLYQDLENINPTEIVYERFQYQRRPNVDLYPVEVIGVIKLWASTHETKITEQTPAQAKNLVTDDKLKKLSLWEPAKPHAMDALRHLLYYLVVSKGDRTWIDRLKPTTKEC